MSKTQKFEGLSKSLSSNIKRISAMQIDQNKIIKNQNKQFKTHLPPLNKNCQNYLQQTARHDLNDSKVSKFLESRFRGYDNKSFSQKIYQRILIKEKEDYKNMSKIQINSQYVNLKQTLKTISEKLNKYLSSKIQKDKLISSGSESRFKNYTFSSNEPYQTNAFNSHNLSNKSQNNEFYSRIEHNNSQIKQNKSIELDKLVKRQDYIVGNDGFELKSKLKEQIQRIKQQLKQQKTNYKKMILQSDKIGNQILNSDALVQQIRSLQNQLNVIQIRKKKLQAQSQITKNQIETIKKGKNQSFQKQYELEEYQAKKYSTLTLNKIKAQRNIQYQRKYRIITALKKDKQAKDKIKTKQYYDILSQLNQIQENSLSIQKKYQSMCQRIQNSKQCYQQLKCKYNKMNKKSASKQNNNIEGSLNIADSQKRISFYKSKKQLDMNQKQPKQILREIEENLQKTHKNIASTYKKSTKNSQQNFQTHPFLTELESQKEDNKQNQVFSQEDINKSKESANKKSKNKDLSKLEDSQIIEDEEQYAVEQPNNNVEDNFQQIYIQENFQEPL